MKCTMAESMDYDLESQEDGLITNEKLEQNKEGVQKRESWNRTLDFLVACVGGSVGLGNVWRFPFLCYRNGGGAFLIPYFLLMVFGSLPLFILEVTLGQYMSAGGMQAWSIIPLFQGLGLTSTIIIFYICTYYNVILAWTLLYLFHSFASHLPWDSCEGSWNTPLCATNFSQTLNSSLSNISLVDPVTEFWERKVLRLSSGIHEMGSIKWDLTLCLVLSWVLVYLCICKGVRSTGKVMYFTAPAPYVFMLIILIRNATLPGAADGVSYYLRPNLTKLADMSVWSDAGKQTFFSSSVCQSVVLTLGSYNKFKHNACRDSVAFALVNAITSFFAGFLVFTILGFMAFQQGRPISEVAESGPGLIFIAYPKAVAQMPLAQFWAVAFFVMILLLGLDSAFLGVEAVVTAITDQFPNSIRRGRRKEILIGIICFILFSIGFIFTFDGGMYVFQLVDAYCGGRVLVLVGCLEVVSISYFYGIHRFHDNLVMMIGNKWLKVMFPYLAVCWTVFTPLLCLMIFIMSSFDYKELSYSRPNESIYYYPGWALGIGWLITISSIIWIPGVAFYHFIKYGFSIEVLKLMLVPHKLKPHQMRPQDKLEKSLKDLNKDLNREIPTD